MTLLRNRRSLDLNLRIDEQMQPTPELFLSQLVWLFTLPIPVACIAWSVTHEELFAEPRAYCVRRSTDDSRWWARKFFYLGTCEYCFSHYVALGAVLITGYRLLLTDWRGIFIAWFSVVWIANQYMSIHGRLRLGIKSQRTEIRVLEEQLSDTPASASPDVKPHADIA